MKSATLGFVAGVLLYSAPTFAQNAPPFFGGGVVAFDPQVSVVNSGVELVDTATVSADQKYVTIGGVATQQRLRTLVTFPVNAVNNVTTGPQGFVGGVNFPGDAPPSAKAPVKAGQKAAAPQIPTPPSPNSWILTRQGTYLVTPLK